MTADDLKNLIDAAAVALHPNGHREHLGASLIGRKCARQLWYTFRWAHTEQFDGRMLRLFQRGHLEEARFLLYLREGGVTVLDADEKTGEQFVVSYHGGHFGGSMDGVGTKGDGWFLFEFKTAGDKQFRKLSKDGLREAKFEHFVQMNVYMEGAGLSRGVYLCVNKNTDEVFCEVVEFDEKIAARYIERAREIVFSDEPPARIASDPSWFECKFCGVRELCFGMGTLPEVNCRTCCHSTPVEGGDALWTCELDCSAVETKEGQKEGCAAHLFNPGLLTGYEVLAIDTVTDEPYITLKTPREETLTLGERHLSSHSFLQHETTA